MVFINQSLSNASHKHTIVWEACWVQRELAGKSYFCSLETSLRFKAGGERLGYW